MRHRRPWRNRTPPSVIIDETRPSAGLTAVTVSAIASEQWTPLATPWSLTAYAVCGPG